MTLLKCETKVVAREFFCLIKPLSEMSNYLLIRKALASRQGLLGGGFFILMEAL